MPILGSSASGAKSRPVAPTIGTATNVGTSRAYNNGAATVTFTAPTSKLPITSYTVTSSPGGFTASGASSPITVTGLQSATAYTFTVTATSAAGTSSASSASNSITATTVPQAPTIGSATAGVQSASVPFTTNATGGSAITTYTVTSSPGSFTGTGASSPITVSGLTAGTAYTFTVTATNANGTSTASSASNSVTPAAPFFAGFAELAASPSLAGYLFANGTDSSGNMYIAGSNRSSDNGANYAYLAKLNSSGVVQWQKNLATSGQNDSGSQNGILKMRVTSNGDIYVIGTLTTSSGTFKRFVAKFNTSGTQQWFYRLNNQSSTSDSDNYQAPGTYALNIDSSENVYAAVGGYNSGVTRGITTLFKFNSSGTLQWQRNLQNNNTTNGNAYQIHIGALAIDSSLNVFAGGTFNDGGSVRFFAHKLNSSGTSQWIRQLDPLSGTSTYASVTLTDAACDSNGDVYFVGFTPNSSAGTPGIIIKYNTGGTIQWQKVISNSSRTAATVNNSIHSIRIDSSNNIYTAGVNRSSESEWGSLAAINKLTTAGSLSSSFAIRSNYGELSIQSPWGLSLDSSSNLYMTAKASYAVNSQYNELIYAKFPNNNSKVGTYSINRGYGIVTSVPTNITIGNSTGSEAASTIVVADTGNGTTSTTPATATVSNDLAFTTVVI
jgi:trimeric autotransporter adhesin